MLNLLCLIARGLNLHFLVEHKNSIYLAQGDPDMVGEVQDAIGDVTFGELEGKWLTSDGLGHPPNPFERALWFQAIMAIRKARKKGWIRELPQIPEPAATGYDKEMLARYFASMDVE